MGIVFVYGVPLHLDLFARLHGIPVGGSHLVLQILARALGGETCHTRADLTGRNTRLICTAAVERQTRRDGQAVARLCILVPCLARTQGVGHLRCDTVLAAYLFQCGIGRPLARLRDAQPRIRSERRMDCLCKRKAHRIRMQRKEKSRAQSECRKRTSLASLMIHKVHLD